MEIAAVFRIESAKLNHQLCQVGVDKRVSMHWTILLITNQIRPSFRVLLRNWILFSGTPKKQSVLSFLLYKKRVVFSPRPNVFFLTKLGYQNLTFQRFRKRNVDLPFKKLWLGCWKHIVVNRNQAFFSQYWSNESELFFFSEINGVCNMLLKVFINNLNLSTTPIQLSCFLVLFIQDGPLLNFSTPSLPKWVSSDSIDNVR